MLHVKLTGQDAEVMVAAAIALEAAKKEKNRLDKDESAAKEVISRELLRLRKINLDLLPNKEIVFVECDGKDAVKVEIKESQRFDLKAFALTHPDLSRKFTKPSPAKYFDSLLPSPVDD